MDDETYQRRSDINDLLIQVCAKLNDVRDVATASRLIPIASELTLLVAQVSVKQTNGSFDKE